MKHATTPARAPPNQPTNLRPTHIFRRSSTDIFRWSLTDTESASHAACSGSRPHSSTTARSRSVPSAPTTSGQSRPRSPDPRHCSSPRCTSCTSASKASARLASTTRTQPMCCASCRPRIQPLSQAPSPPSHVTRLRVSRQTPRSFTSPNSSERTDAQASRWPSVPYEPQCLPSGYRQLCVSYTNVILDLERQD